MSPQPLRILYVSGYYKPAYVYGGPVKSISTMAEAMVDLGANVSALTTNANGRQKLNVNTGRPYQIGAVDVTYFDAPHLPPRSYFYSPALSRAIGERITEFDIAILECLWMHPMHAAVAACRRRQVPYVVPLRGQLMPWALTRKSLKKRWYLAGWGRRYLDGAAALHCTDPSEARAAADLGLRAPPFVVPNGVDVDRFAHLPPRRGFRNRLGIAPDVPLLLVLGRLHQIKRPDIAVAALAQARKTDPRAVLVLAGPDEENLEPSLRIQAAQLACRDHVVFTGLLDADEVLGALADADLLLMPSAVQESFGMSAVEALAAGVPILTSPGVPVGHWAAQAGAGRVAACDAAAFGCAVRQLLADRVALKAMGTRGSTLARTEFNIPTTARSLLNQLQRIVTAGHPAPTTSLS